MRTIAFGLVSGLALSAAGPAAAQDYPTQPIEFVCATSAGSTAATWCQLMAELLAKPDNLGQPVNVTFKGGGSGNEAAVYTAGKPADGYTILHANASWSGYMNLPTFSPDPEAFDLVVKVENFLYALGTHADSEYQTLDDVIAAAEEQPGTIGVAGNKIGSIHHKHILSLFEATGVEVNYIPYEGSGDAVKDVLGQHVPLGLGSIGQWMPHVESGSIRPLVVLNEERVEAFGDVPIPSELGFDYPIQHQWQGAFVLEGTPDDVRTRIADGFAKATETPEYKEYLKTSPHVVPALETDPATLAEGFTEELETFRAFMQENGMI